MFWRKNEAEGVFEEKGFVRASGLRLSLNAEEIDGVWGGGLRIGKGRGLDPQIVGWRREGVKSMIFMALMMIRGNPAG